MRVANMVDPLYTVVAKFPKRLLPARVAAAGKPGVRLADMPWTEAEALLDPDRVVVLPLGAAAKEHGPHLLLRNDEILAELLARRRPRSRARWRCCPTLTYGFYPAFLEYPGSVSPLRRHPARRGRADLPLDRALRAAALLRAQHRGSRTLRAAAAPPPSCWPARAS